jgi:hypothetical protein
MKIEYHPFTVDDLYDAEIHYDQLQSGLSQAFRAEVIQTIDWPSQTSPGIWKWETVTCSIIEDNQSTFLEAWHGYSGT